MKIVAFEVEVGGITSIIDDMNSLKKAVKDTNKEFGNAKFGTEEYKKQERQLAILKNLQKGVRDEARKTGREQVIQADKGKNSYRAMNAELVNLRTRFKELSEADRNSSVGSNLIKQIGSLDGQLKRIDASIGLYQRNVGNYRQALIGIGDVVTGGLLTGGIQAVTAQIVNQYREALQLIADFEKGLSSLSAITGLTGEDLDELGQKAVDLSVKYSNTATDVLKAFQLIGSASPELLQNADNLALVTEQVQILAKAGGIDLPVAAEAVTKALNQFGLTAAESAQAVDILATSQQRGTATIAQLSESLKNVGSVAKASNISFEQTNVLLQALAKGGLVGAEAGTKLRGILLRLAQTNRDDLNPATNDFQDILSTLGSEIDGVSDAAKIFGAENAAAALTLIEQVGVVNELSGELNQYGSAIDQAKTNSDNLQGSTAKFAATYNALILNVEKGTGIFGGLARSIVDLGTKILQLADDLSTGQLSTFEIFQGGSDPFIQLSKSLEKLNGLQSKATTELQKQQIELEKIKASSQAFADANDAIFVSQKTRESNLRTISALREKEEEVQKEIIRLSKEEQAAKEDLNKTDKESTKTKNEETEATKKSTAAKKEAAQDDSLQKLNKEQSELSQLIKVGILDGIDYTDALNKWKENQLELNAVSEQFKEIQRSLNGETIAGEQSVKFLTDSIKELKTAISTADPDSIKGITNDLIEAEKKLEAVKNEIADQRFNSENEGSTGVSSTGVDSQVESINASRELQQAAAADQIEDEQRLKDLRVRIALQADIDIIKARLTLWKAGTDQALLLEAQLAEKTKALNENTANSTFQDRIEEIRLLELAQLEANARSSASVEEKAAKEKEIQTNAAIDTLNAELELAKTSNVRKAEIAKELADIEVGIEKEKDEELKLLEEERSQRRLEGINILADSLGSIAASVESLIDSSTAKQVESVRRGYDAQIEAAEGNAERQTELAEQRDAEIEAIERAAFERTKQIQKAQVLIAAAVGAINILSAPTTIPDPFGTIFKGVQIAALAVSTFAQLSAIDSASFFKGGYTGKGYGQPDETGARVAGKVHQDEYVVPNKVLATKEGKALVDRLEGMRTGRPMKDNTPMTNAGMMTPQLIPNFSPSRQEISVDASAKMDDNQMNQLANIIGAQAGKAIEKATLKAAKEVETRRMRSERLKDRL